MLRSTFNRLVFIGLAIVWAVIVVRAFLNRDGPEIAAPTIPQPRIEAFAREQLNALQERSFAENIELCGIIYETPDGQLGVLREEGGGEATCDIAFFDEGDRVAVASFHTHGRHSREYDGEVPSLTDIQSDIDVGVDGYIATPGGRLWHIDHEQEVARLVCGPGCMAQDPRYFPCRGDLIARGYTIEELRARFEGSAPEC